MEAFERGQAHTVVISQASTKLLSVIWPGEHDVFNDGGWGAG